MTERKFDYKKPEELREYLDKHGRILPRRETGLSAVEQRKMGRAVKRARSLALLPKRECKEREATQEN